MIREISLVFIVAIVLIFLFYKSTKDEPAGEKTVPDKKHVPKKKKAKKQKYERHASVKTVESIKTGEVLQVRDAVNSRITSMENEVAPVTIDQVKHLIDESEDSIEASIDALSKELQSSSTGTTIIKPETVITKITEAKLERCLPDARYYGGTSFD